MTLVKTPSGDRFVEVDDALRLQRQLDAAQQITHIGSWEWDLTTGTLTWSDELFRIYGLTPQCCEMTLEGVLERIHPDDRERVQREVRAVVERGGPLRFRERIVWPDGSVRTLDSVGEVLLDAEGRPVSLVGTCRDVTDDPREQMQRLQAGERQALEMLATGAPLPDILARLARVVEEGAPDTLASILLVDDTGTRIQHGAAPSLPDAYNRAIDGIIGPQAGSCGAAAFHRRPVFAADIETDPLWESIRESALRHGLRACWSFPILASDGWVLGTFAVYYRQPRTEDPAVAEVVAHMAHVAAIAIERRQIDEQMRALSERTEAVRENERTRIARELQEDLGQSLTALMWDIGWVTRQVADNPVATEKLEGMTQHANRIIDSMQRISARLRPSILDVLGLEAAVKVEGGEFTARTGIPCELRAQLHALELDPDLTTMAFRVFQDALTNVTRHAGASRVSVDLGIEGSMLVLEVADDGVGLPAAGARGRSLRLLGMDERARRMGGRCVARLQEPTGTVVSLRVPLRLAPVPPMA